MKILDRYILAGFIQSLIYCIVAFIFLYIVADLFNYIDEMIKSQVSVHTVLVYYGTFIPTIFVQVAPMAALLAAIYTLSNLKKYNELTAIMISGVSLWKILKPILFASMLLSLSVLYVNEKLVPRYTPISYEIRNDKIRHIGKKAKTVLKDIAIFGENNRIIYAGSFDIQKKILKDIIIHENDKNQNLVMKLTAQKGWWEKGRWVFENGTSYRLNESGHMIGTPSPFRRKIMDLKERPRDFKKKGKNPEYMNFHELRSYINRFSKKSSSTTKKLTVDLWYKTSLPFVSIIVIFVAAPFAFALKKGGLLIGIGISIVIGLLFYGISAIFVAMGKAGILPPILAAWMGNLLFLTIGLFSMKKCR